MIVVTGKDVYMVFTLNENYVLKVTHSVLSRKDDSLTPFSTNYIQHTWLADGRFVICTDAGQILLIEATGDFKNLMISDKDKQAFPINSVISF